METTTTPNGQATDNPPITPPRLTAGEWIARAERNFNVHPMSALAAAAIAIAKLMQDSQRDVEGSSLSQIEINW